MATLNSKDHHFEIVNHRKTQFNTKLAPIQRNTHGKFQVSTSSDS